MNKKYKYIKLLLITILILTTNLYAISTIEKTQKTYQFTLNKLSAINVVILNFPEGNKEKYNSIKAKFQDAGEELFGQNYITSFEKFLTLNTELSKFLEKISKDYLSRTKEILDSTAKESFNILIEYGPNSSYLKYFKEAFDPLTGIMPYNENFTAKKYHFFKDRSKIQAYISEGYKKYNYAKKLFEDSDIDLLKKRKKKTIKVLNFLIQRYLNVISLCRQAKQHGIEIYKIRKLHDYGAILAKYNLTSKKLTPIFDDRIPEKYKVDAIDNKLLLYPIELERLKKNKAANK